MFLHELRKRFGTSIYDDPLGKIAKLVQLGKVSQYRAEFESLMTRMTGVPDFMFLNFFVWGLKTEIRRKILMAQQNDLSDTMAKAQLFEDKNEDLLGRHRREGYRTMETQTRNTTMVPSVGTKLGSYGVLGGPSSPRLKP